MLPFIALGTVLAAVASEPDWKDELRQPRAFRGKGLVVASWPEKSWRLHRSPVALVLRQKEGRRHRAVHHSLPLGSLIPPRPGTDDEWEVAPSVLYKEAFSEAFPSAWMLVRSAVPPDQWEHYALTMAIRATSSKWDGHPTWKDWWRAQLVKPSFVHRGLRMTPLERATGRKPLLTMSSNELLAALDHQEF